MRNAIFALTAVGLATGVAAAQGRIIILIGPPAGGAAAQAEFLHKRYNLPVISSDALIRANPQAFDKGKDFRVNDMEPHSDPVLNQLLQERLKTLDLAQGLILVRYPATKEHADFLAGILRALSPPPRLSIFQLDIPDSVVRKRVKGGKSPEVDPNTLEQQLKDYRREMGFISAYFPNATFNQVDATRKPAKITEELRSILEK